MTDEVQAQGLQHGLLLHELLARQAAANPGAPALACDGRMFSYGQLHDRVDRLARVLAAEGTVGDRVALLAWNCPECVEMIYAVAAAGRILVPLNARLAPAELLYQLQQAQVDRLVGERQLLTPLLDQEDFPTRVRVTELGPAYDTWRDGGTGGELPQAQPGDAVWILFTSGSTGRPKGAVLTHDSFLAGLRSAAIGRPVLPGDRYYYPFPLFHVAAHNVLLQHAFGAEVVLAKSFDSDATLRACREQRVTTLSLAPTMIAMLMQHPEFEPRDLASVRTIGYGASAMPQAQLQRLLRETDVGLCQSYGMTELSGSISFLTVQDHERAAGNRPQLLQSVGKPLPTADVRLAGDDGGMPATGHPGEILVRAQQCMSGYWQDPARTAEAIVDGWLHTGDIGRFDEDGYLYIVDRKKDMIISGGENIASLEVEEALRRHPTVRDCAVIGLPDARWGEIVAAVLVLDAATGDTDLASHCRDHLAGYKTPKRWFRVDSLPLNASGKIDKPVLRQQFSDTAY